MNNKVKWAIGISGLLLVFIGVALTSGLFGGPSDKELIAAALKEAIQASREGRPGGVLEFISDEFQVNGERFGSANISKTIKDLQPDVEVERPTPTISGDSATIMSPVRLSVSLPPLGITVGEVTMRFARESGTKWLIIPTKKWRLVQVDIPESVMNEVRDQFGGMTQL